MGSSWWSCCSRASLQKINCQTIEFLLCKLNFDFLPIFIPFSPIFKWFLPFKMKSAKFQYFFFLVKKLAEKKWLIAGRSLFQSPNYQDQSVWGSGFNLSLTHYYHSCALEKACNWSWSQDQTQRDFATHEWDAKWFYWEKFWHRLRLHSWSWSRSWLNTLQQRVWTFPSGEAWFIWWKVQERGRCWVPERWATHEICQFMNGARNIFF